jgi:hypothetical protein
MDVVRGYVMVMGVVSDLYICICAAAKTYLLTMLLTYAVKHLHSSRWTALPACVRGSCKLDSVCVSDCDSVRV